MEQNWLTYLTAAGVNFGAIVWGGIVFFRQLRRDRAASLRRIEETARESADHKAEVLSRINTVEQELRALDRKQSEQRQESREDIISLHKKLDDLIMTQVK